MNGPGSNLLFTMPALLVLTGLVLPIAFLDGGATYLAFLWSNAEPVTIMLSAWWVLAYWGTRRLASVMLLRSSGAKLRVGDGHQ